MGNRTELLNMVYIVTEASPPDHLYNLPEYLDADDLRAVWERLGLRWNGLIAEEMDNIADGYGRRYFLANETYMHQHRAEWGVYVPEPKAEGAYQLTEVDMDEYFENLRKRRENGDMEWFGPIYDDLGYACPAEQKRFYQSDAWKRCSAAVRYMYQYRCGRCRKTGAGLHVHHERPIQSVFSDRCYTNFADTSMRLYCEDCHKELHKVLARMDYHFIVVSEEEAQQERERLRTFWQEYHKRDLCEYCRYFRDSLTVDTYQPEPGK